ncbi:ATP-grasp fold amidoligase family protein [Halalkalibacter sp. AB-rgal2]|uniref:ATP-grasp fold amidoligase family protein n=1 Tax=Halalkalibacter sp. AB-rgal2 TaxID=3242695 RepID=UPI00359D5228
MSVHKGNTHPVSSVLNRLVYVEAKVNKLKDEIRNEKKKIKYIRRSRIWRYSFFIRKAFVLLERIKFFYRLLWNGNHYIHLEESYDQLVHQYKKSKEKEGILTKELHQLMINSKFIQDEVEKSTFKDLAKQAKDKGEIIEYIEDLTKNKQFNNLRFDRAITSAAKEYREEKSELRGYIYARALEGFRITGIPEFLIREVENSGNVELHQAASFSAMLSMRARTKQVFTNIPELVLDDKETAYHFVDKLSVRRPWVQSFYNKNRIPLLQNSVIKPQYGAGSRGVYLHFHENQIFDVKRERTLSSTQELKNAMQQDLNEKWVHRDRWLVEELIFGNFERNEPARDFKFYCFYGKVALILEIKRYPTVKYCWWNNKGERISTGKYDEMLYNGMGINATDIDLAEYISSEIPAPFIRVDFLKSENELIFGEFTPKPGNYDQFNIQTDQWLGDCYLEAEQRLINDLLDRKKFQAYKGVMQEL